MPIILTSSSPAQRRGRCWKRRSSGSPVRGSRDPFRDRIRALSPFTLTPGTRLGSHEIVSAIGEGGMGQVYRAHDTALGRDVAIKVLPDLFAGDADRLARFEREARVLASLNHPN